MTVYNFFKNKHQALNSKKENIAHICARNGILATLKFLYQVHRELFHAKNSLEDTPVDLIFYSYNFFSILWAMDKFNDFNKNKAFLAAISTGSKQISSKVQNLLKIGVNSLNLNETLTIAASSGSEKNFIYIHKLIGLPATFSLVKKFEIDFLLFCLDKVLNNLYIITAIKNLPVTEDLKVKLEANKNF